MIKRPLAAAAFLIVLVSLFITCFLENIYFPSSDLEDGDIIYADFKVTDIISKSNSTYLYVNDGSHKDLLVASADLNVTTDVRIGCTIRARCSFTEWGEARNRGNFDEKSYYRSLGLYQKYYLISYEILDNHIDVLKNMLRSFRTQLVNSIENCTDTDTAGILTAITSGDKTLLDDNTKSLFQVSGLAHILAISGLHISFVGLGLFRLLRKRLDFYPAAFISLTAAICYSIMTGSGVSSIRACIIIAVRLGATALGKRYDSLSSISLAAILLLLANPFYITNTAFQLSFSAVLSMALIEPELLTFLKGGFKPTGLMISIITSMASGISVAAGTLPVIIETYHEVPLYSILLNVIVIGLISYIFAGALIGGLIGIIFPAVGRFILGLPVILTRITEYLCLLEAKLPLSRIITADKSGIYIGIYYFFLAGSILALHIYNNHHTADDKALISAGIFSHASGSMENDRSTVGNGKNSRHRFRFLRKSLIIIASFLALALTMISSGRSDTLRITFFDVDQGKCILIISPSGTTYMIDAGSTTVDEVYNYRIESGLKSLGVSRISYLFITHPDTDHISGALELLADTDSPIDVGMILIADFDENEKYQQLLYLAERRNIPVTEIYTGVSINDGILSLTCLQPEQNAQNLDVNDMSAVIYARFGSFSALFTGDISESEELKLISSWKPDSSLTLLDVAHHGSKYSTCQEFLDAMQPGTAVISAGVDNTYGHPAQSVLDRLEASSVTIYNTQTSGEIDICADKNGIISISEKLENP